MQSKYKQRSVKRIVVSFVLIMFFFTALFVRLIYIQVFSADTLSGRQTAYMTENIALTAARGDIYDRNMTLLAKDASCMQVIVYPNSIEDAEATSTFLAEILELSYESVYQKVSNVKMNYLTVKKGIDSEIGLAIRNEDIRGIEVVEDKKRYYTDSATAQYILGFVGADHIGRYGIEAVYNSILKGVDGTQTILVDALRRKIESSVVLKNPSTPGNHLILSMDSQIQYFADKAVLDAYLANRPKRVIAIVSAPSTGEILAVSAYPSFDLSDAWTIDQEFANAYAESFEGLSQGEKQLLMWQNPATSFIYEPGSTFKAITVASALEEGVVNLDSTFDCSGSLAVSGVRIKCAVFPNGHGKQNLAKAVENSCNPAMMNIAMRLGPNKYYEYMYAFGFGQKSGVDLDGEEAGIIRPNQDIKQVDFVTIAFGQGVAVTPMQMIMGVNAVVNGGYLYEPIVVSKVLDPETGKVIENHEISQVRQVISNTTSDIMRDILRQSGEKTLGEDEYKIGGKTGTAQKFLNGRYVAGKNVASFYGFAPYDDPELSVIFIVDEFSGSNVFGSTAAAPFAADLIRNSLDYMHMNDAPVSVNAEMSVNTIVADLRGKTFAEAQMILAGLDRSYIVSGETSGIVVGQTPLKTICNPGDTVVLTLSGTDEDEVVMPDLKGMSVTQASLILGNIGLELEMSGGGLAFEQSIPPGEKVKIGSRVKVEFRYIK